MTEIFGATFIQNPGTYPPFLKNLKISKFVKNTNVDNNNNKQQHTRNNRARLRGIGPFLRHRHVNTIHANTIIKKQKKSRTGKDIKKYAFLYYEKK